MEEKIKQLETRVDILEDFIGFILEHLNGEPDEQNFELLRSEYIKALGIDK